MQSIHSEVCAVSWKTRYEQIKIKSGTGNTMMTPFVYFDTGSKLVCKDDF